MAPRGNRSRGLLLATGALAGVAQVVLLRQGSGFAFSVAPSAASLSSTPGAAAHRAAAPGLADASAQTPSSWAPWPVAGMACALGAALLRSKSARTAPLPPVRVACVEESLEGGLLAGASPALDARNQEALVAMASDGGRRKRLGVGGRVCMLTGKKKHKGYTRTFSEKKNKRFWRPNTHWKKFWWDKEKKWVRLYVSARAVKLVDTLGLDKMAEKAGLDLYAWSKPHWEAGSRQPLALKVGYTRQAQRDKRFWPDYLPKLNQGAPLSEVTEAPQRKVYTEIIRHSPRKWKNTRAMRQRGEGTPPKRLEVSKMVAASSADAA